MFLSPGRRHRLGSLTLLTENIPFGSLTRTQGSGLSVNLHAAEAVIAPHCHRRKDFFAYKTLGPVGILAPSDY